MLNFGIYLVNHEVRVFVAKTGASPTVMVRSGVVTVVEVVPLTDVAVILKV